MLLLGEGVTRAAEHAINDELTTLGGRGGLIAIDVAGVIAMPFNTAGMYRGRADHTGRIEVDIFE
jgi:beta-aspartyl-peptidase (threonine type)